MTEEQFRIEIEAIRGSIAVTNRLVEMSLNEHTRTQGRVDSVVSSVRDGLREDIELVIRPALEKLDSHGKKIDDHETRIRGLEKSGTKRDVILGGAAGMMGGVAGLGIGAVIEAVKALLKIKGGP